MFFPCISAARRFSPERHLPFLLNGRQVGWLRRADLGLMRRWPQVFACGADRVALLDRLGSVETHSAALGEVIATLAGEGHIPGWRGESYAIRNDFDDAPLAFIERAAARFFGTATYAVHVNGIIADSVPDRPQAVPSSAPRLWIARRSANKATDPDMLDHLVGGGIGWGLSVRQTVPSYLLKPI